MNTLAVIPARYRSSRFPGKPLVPLLGVPMIVRVARLTAEAFGVEHTVVATDDDRIAATVREAGFRVVLTSPDHPTGTDRLAEVADACPADLYVNVQGDEPLLDPAHLRTVVAHKARWPGEVLNAMCPLGPDEDPRDVNIPKVVTDGAGRLLYMSRAPIPGSKSDAHPPSAFYKQVCIYAFEREHLRRFRAHGGKSALEAREDIEILRFFELGIPVRMVEIPGGSLAVDRPEDVEAVERRLRERADAR